MDYEWDEAKNKANAAKHGVPFEAAEAFDWESALVVEDARAGYGEARFVAVGFLDDRLHVMAFTRRGGKIRVISLRKANKREHRYYDETID